MKNTHLIIITIILNNGWVHSWRVTSEGSRYTKNLISAWAKDRKTGVEYAAFVGYDKRWNHQRINPKVKQQYDQIYAKGIQPILEIKPFYVRSRKMDECKGLERWAWFGQKLIIY